MEKKDLFDSISKNGREGILLDWLFEQALFLLY